MLRISAIIVFLFGTASGIAQAADINDEFQAGLPKHWNTCQMYAPDRDVLTTDDPDEAGDKVTRIVVDKATLGGRECPETTLLMPMDGSPVSEEGAESLGPSVVDPNEATWEPKKKIRNPYCTSEVLKRSWKIEGACIQREEMRLAKSKTGDPRETRYYSFKFRMPGDVPDTTHSIRWIVAQWKMEPTEYTDPSPFLALRYDDGILHVTVQNKNCRCLVASAKLNGGRHYAWPDDEVTYCVKTSPGPGEGDRCEASGLTAKYYDNPDLESPKNAWVEMQFAVQAGDGAKIEIRQNGRPIVDIAGDIGYALDLRPGKPEPSTKFKMGHYRDYIRSTETIEIDRVAVSATKPWK